MQLAEWDRTVRAAHVHGMTDCLANPLVSFLEMEYNRLDLRLIGEDLTP